MKEQVKITIFGISIFYSILIIILMLFSLFRSVITIEIFDTDYNRKKLNEYKEEVLILEQNSCTNAIMEMINHYEKTSYNGEVNLTEIYIPDLTKAITMSSLSMDAIKNCNLTDEELEKYNFSQKQLLLIVQPQFIIEDYLVQYEFGKDIFITQDRESLNNISYHLIKSTELKMISDLIQIVTERDVIDESY